MKWKQSMLTLQWFCSETTMHAFAFIFVNDPWDKKLEFVLVICQQDAKSPTILD